MAFTKDCCLLSSVCARANLPFLAPPHLHCPHFCNTIARLLRNTRPPPPSTTVLYAIHHTKLVLAVACKGQSMTVSWAVRPATRYRAARGPLPRVPAAFQGSKCVDRVLKRRRCHVRTWPLHDIAFTNIAWCMAYKGGSVGGRIGLTRGLRCVRGELERREYQVKARYQVRANALLVQTRAQALPSFTQTRPPCTHWPSQDIRSL